MEEKTNDSLLVYDIKLPSTQATSAQDFLMRNMVDLKDGNNDNLPPGIPRAFINFEKLHLPETTPLDDLRKCQFAIELKKEICSPISTLRVIIRIPTRSPKKHSQNVKLLENLLECTSSMYSVQTISQVKYISDDDKLKLFATYLGSCNNCIVDGSITGVKAAFDDADVVTDDGCTDDDDDEVGSDTDSVCGSTNIECVSMDTDDTTSCDEEGGGALVVDEDVETAGKNGVPPSNDESTSNVEGREVDLAQALFGDDGENKNVKSSSSSSDSNAAVVLRSGEVNDDDNTAKPGCGDCTAAAAESGPTDNDSAKPMVKRTFYRAKKYPKILVNSSTFSENPPLSYKDKLEFARIMAVDVNSNGMSHTHFAYYDKGKERIIETIREEESKKLRKKKAVKRKRKVVKSEGEESWKKLKIVNVNEPENKTQSCD